MTGDDNQNKEANAPATDEIPEVVAEIVDETAPSSSDPFDEAPQKEKTTAPERSLISAGVLLFAGLVLVAAAAGAVWYFTKSDNDKVSGAETTVTQAAPTAQKATPDSADTPVDKLANATVSNTKPNAPPAPPPGETFTEAVASLPAEPETVANTDLQAAAKDTAFSTATASGDQQTNEDNAPSPDTLDAEEISLNAPSPADPPQDAPPIAVDPPSETQRDIIPSTEFDELCENLDAIDAPAFADISASPVAPDEPRLDTADNPSAVPAPDVGGLDPEIIASLEAALAEERQRTGALEATLAEARRDIEATNAALADARAQAEEARAAISTLRAENDALKTAPKTSPVAAGAIALNAIFEAAENGTPFASELATLKRAAPNSSATTVLAQYADTGAPVLSEIREGFNVAARAGLASANRASADGVVERYGARIAGLFNMRPATPQPGASPGAIISRAEYAVHEGDLARALIELDALPAPAQQAMSEWVALARQRVAFDAALRSLNTELAERARKPGNL